jgi:glycosyltransferase involved in cell wall biosynthesis
VLSAAREVATRAAVRIACHGGQLLQPVPGGIGRYVRELLDRLPDAGAETVLFAAGSRPRLAPPRVPWLDLGWPYGSMRYELWHRARRPLVYVDADVVHAPSLAVPAVRGIPLVVTVHDIAFRRYPHNTTRRGAAFHQRGLEIARDEAVLVLTPSAFTRNELIRDGFQPDDVVVTSLGVGRAAARADDEVDAVVSKYGIRRPYVLTVGTVEPRKDLPTLVAAFRRLRVRRPGLELLIVGPAGWGEVRGLEQPGVRVMGPQPWAVVDALYRRASVCCVASRYEGFGLPALEALARGAPLVAADGSALSEVVGDAGLLFPPGDVVALTDAIERTLDDDALRADLSERGPRRTSTRTWEASAAAHVAAFRSAVSREPRRG